MIIHHKNNLLLFLCVCIGVGELKYSTVIKHREYMGAISATYDGSLMSEANMVIPLTPCFSEGMAALMPGNNYYDNSMYFDFAAHMSELFEFFRVKKMKFTLKSKIVQSVNTTAVMPVVYGMVDYDARNYSRWVAACQELSSSGSVDAVDKNSILDTGNSIEVPWTNDITFTIDASSLNSTLSTLRSARSLSSTEWIAQLSDREHSLGNLFVRIADISGVLSADGKADIFEVYCDYEIEFIKPHAQQLFSQGLPGVDVGPSFTLVNLCEKTGNTQLLDDTNIFTNAATGNLLIPGTHTVFDPTARGILAPGQIQGIRAGLVDAASNWNRLAFQPIPDHIYQITYNAYETAKFTAGGTWTILGHGSGFEDVKMLREGSGATAGEADANQAIATCFFRAIGDQEANVYNNQEATLTSGDYYIDFTSTLYAAPLTSSGNATLVITDLGVNHACEAL